MCVCVVRMCVLCVHVHVCVCMSYVISSRTWSLRGGEGALRDGLVCFLCFPSFPLLTTSWRCLVSFLHKWKKPRTPPHSSIA